ncbi:MAG TPA: DUF433 domain-containing protein [Chthoniobacteraceae bacterium]|jgi:uncharacterized protein (DUF433 family)|nr:DUF433 domain-containing protein [Chthoniobacteraceae bacterium]
MKPSPYVELRGEGWYLAGERISVDSIIYSFRDGLSPEAISRECFPRLTLEQVYGAITFYLANRTELDAYLEKGEAEAEEWRAAQRAKDSAFVEKMARARRELLPTP